MSRPSSTRPERAVRLASYAAGLALAVAALVTWQVPADAGDPRTRVSFEVALTGELGVAPTGTIARANDLTADPRRRALSGGFRVRNQTPAPLALRLRAVPSTPALDKLLVVTLGAGERRLFRGPLGELRSGTGPAVKLPPGEAETISVRARLRTTAEDAGGVAARIRLELPTEVLR